MEIAASGTLQVEALSPIDNYTAFAKEGAYAYDAETGTLAAQIEFTSGETAYGAKRQGSFNLIAALKDENSNVIVSGVIPFELIDTGYDGVVEPPSSFRDEIVEALERTLEAEARAEQFLTDSVAEIKTETESGKAEITAATTAAKSEISLSEQNAITSIGNAKSGAVSEITGAKLGAQEAIATDLANAENEIDTAKENAKNEIDGWTDQSARLASLEENTANLQLDKANAGYLQFNKAKLTTASNNATSLPLTLCATYDCKEYPLGGLFSILTTHKIIGYAGSAAGSMSGFEFGFCYNQNWGATMFGAVLSTPDTVISTARHGYDIGVLTTTEALRAKFVGKHTFIASISADITNGAPQATLYLDGVPLTGLTNTIYNGGLQSAELGTGQGSIWSGTKRYFASDWIPTISNLKLSRLKIFNCVLPATSADDADGIGYTIEDYAQGIDEPPTMQDPSATYRALLSLQNYTVQNGSTQQVFDVSGNANDATATLVDGGSVKGANDIGVSRLIDFIKGQSA